MKPDCYKCPHHRLPARSEHIRCAHITAKVKGHPYGIAHGWFMWPDNFDPYWLLECSLWAEESTEKMSEKLKSEATHENTTDTN